MSNDELLRVIISCELNTRDSEQMTIEQIRFKMRVVNAICNMCLETAKTEQEANHDRR